MTLRGKALWLIAIINITITISSCQPRSDNSSVKEEMMTKQNAPTIKPIELKKAEKGRLLHKRILKKYLKLDRFYEKPSLFGALTENPIAIICVPIEDWGTLSEEDRDALSQYAASLVQEVKGKPFEYNQIPANAPIAPMISKNVLNMASNSWGVFAGKFSGDGRDINLDVQVRSGQINRDNDSTQRTPKQKNSLDLLAANITVRSERVILSYDIDGGFAILHINPRIWNALKRGEQQQLGDSLAGTAVWDEMGLINARLFVYRTEVGRIKPLVTGGREFLLN